MTIIDSDSAQKIIDAAKGMCPVSVWVRGQMTEECYQILDECCTIRGGAVYMEGSRDYYIRYNPPG